MRTIHSSRLALRANGGMSKLPDLHAQGAVFWKMRSKAWLRRYCMKLSMQSGLHSAALP